MKDDTAEFIFTNGNNPKIYVEKEELLRTAKEILINNLENYLKEIVNGNNLYTKELDEAIDFAKEEYKDRVVFFVGSFYIYGTVVEKLND